MVQQVQQAVSPDLKVHLDPQVYQVHKVKED